MAFASVLSRAKAFSVQCLVVNVRSGVAASEFQKLFQIPTFPRRFSSSAHNNSTAPTPGTPAIKDTYLVNYLKSLSRPEDFWAEAASGLIWDKKWEKVLDNSDPPFSKWFVGGKMSVCYNALDRHCDDGFGDQTILFHDSPVTNSKSSYTYKSLLHEVRHLAGYLNQLGVKPGDRVIIYMPMIAEAVIAMLACSRIGAIHSVVFGGFAAKELATRISHAKAAYVICGSGGIERGKEIDYKKIVNQAVELADCKPKNVIVYQRPGLQKVGLQKGRDSDWAEGISTAKPVDCVPVDANHPLYILYTSGTTGAPKAVVRPSGGYAVALNWSMYNVFGMKPEDTWWAASDFGWVVGHSYICYGPLLHRNPSVIYEGKATGTPNAGSFFRIIDDYNVKGMFTTPTAMRTIRQEDPHGQQQKHEAKSLKYMFIAGEHCDEETKHWAKSAFGALVLDNWWQTETGWAITSTCVGLGSSLNPPPKSSGHAVPGWDVRVVDSETGTALKPGELGRIVIKLPLPPGALSNLWEQEDLFKKTYFSKYPEYFDTMDAGLVDADGYVSVISRVDDIINVSGCRISLGAIEECVLRHPALAECAVVGVKDDLRGQIPIGLFVLQSDCQTKGDQIIKEIISAVRNEIGPIASFKSACIVPKLPKTRSGKIARPSLVALAEGKPVKIPVTIEDASVYPEIKTQLRTIGYAKTDAEIS